MKSFKEALQIIKRKLSSKQGLFVAMAFILFLGLTWFVVSNFIFLVDNLNQAFGSTEPVEQTSTEFDIEAFQELNLIR